MTTYARILRSFVIGTPCNQSREIELIGQVVAYARRLAKTRSRETPFLASLFGKSVILSEAKNLHWFAGPELQILR
jgi:hypothetical protein